MPTYLVRTTGTLRLIGVFVASDSTALFDTIYEVRDPGGCEYFKLKNDDGVFLDAQFTAEVEGGGEPVDATQDLFVCLRPVLEYEAEEPQLSEKLSQRLDAADRAGKGWTSLTLDDFAKTFGAMAVPA